MTCPNKNNPNWKIMVDALGETSAYAVFAQHGLPDIDTHPFYQGNRAKYKKDILVVSTIQRIIEGQQAEELSNDLETPVQSTRNAKAMDNRKLQFNKLNAQITYEQNRHNYAKVSELKGRRREIEEDIENLTKVRS